MFYVLFLLKEVSTQKGYNSVHFIFFYFSLNFKGPDGIVQNILKQMSLRSHKFCQQCGLCKE